jgi:rSAM/selenodomain-associated transferase 2
MKLSIIIPVLNECEQLPRTISTLKTQISNHEMIVIDGGSTDGTREWLAQQKELLVVDAARGRGMQMNAGASVASGDALLFLHADCALPPNAIHTIQQVLRQSDTMGGAFLIRFAETHPRALSTIAKGINARTLVTKTATGDQGIFVRRAVFDAIGGFANWPLFEDVDFVTRLKAQGKFVIIREAVTISARRYLAHGPWRTTFLMYALRVGYWLGVPPTKLYQWFQDVRPHLPDKS